MTQRLLTLQGSGVVCRDAFAEGIGVAGGNVVGVQKTGAFDELLRYVER